MFARVILPVGILAGTIIGAGMFALPYAFAHAGILTGLVYLTLMTGVFLLIHLMYAEIGLRSNDHHRLVGHAARYLGARGRYITVITSILGMLCALTIYLVLSISFTNLVAPEIPVVYAIAIFWALGSYAIFWEVNNLARTEFVITIGMIAIMSVIAGMGLGKGGALAAAPLINTESLLLPFGVVLFSLSGRVAIPAVLGYFRKNNLGMEHARRAIIMGTIIPGIFYALFALGIVGLSGDVSEDAVTGIRNAVHPTVMALIGVLGLISLWSSYIVIGRDLKKSLEYDFQIPHWCKITIVVAFPILLYFAGFQSFLGLVAIAGSIFVGLESILVVIMWRKARHEPYGGPAMMQAISPIAQYGIILVFVCGIVYEVVRRGI